MALAAGMALSSASTVSAVAPDTPRQDPYVEIVCSTSPTDSYLAKRVDARAIQPDKDPGGKDTATAQYNAKNPFGEACVESDPVHP